MIEWAKRAGKLVLQEAEELHEDNVITFCNLALFWNSEGSWRIALLHKGVSECTKLEGNNNADAWKAMLVSSFISSVLARPNYAPNKRSKLNADDAGSGRVI